MGEPQAGREWRRQRAWELKEEGWTQKAIAEALGVTAGAVSQWCKRARTDGVEGLMARPRTGRPPRLTTQQREQLVELLSRGAESHGFRGDVWTCQRVGEVIRREFGVRYHPAHVGRLLHASGWTVQQPVRRARQQDPEAVKRWREERWPALEKRQPTRAG